ncbi:FHA domain-containing protein [Kitasatospora sp. NPDC097643]|uniref:FHA domain-containing protein n=1 Tax=Kitasatospora sp. NPDC097643 TaxID=3157230 RepID=UPI003332FEF8
MRPTPQKQDLPRLVVDSPEQLRGQVYELADKPMLVGRGSDCQIHVGDPKISRRHAVVWWSDGHTTVEDLASTNGTLLNGHPVYGQTVLHSGDVIDFGPFEVHYEEPRDAAATVVVTDPGHDVGASDRTAGLLKAAAEGSKAAAERAKAAGASSLASEPEGGPAAGPAGGPAADAPMGSAGLEGPTEPSSRVPGAPPKRSEPPSKASRVRPKVSEAPPEAPEVPPKATDVPPKAADVPPPKPTAPPPKPSEPPSVKPGPRYDVGQQGANGNLSNVAGDQYNNPHYNVGRQGAGGNLSNVAGNQYYNQYTTYVGADQRREIFFRRIADIHTRARHLVLVGLLLLLIGAGVSGWAMDGVDPDDTNPLLSQLVHAKAGNVPVGGLGLGTSITGLVLLVVGITLHVVAIVRVRRFEQRQSQQEQRYGSYT